MSSIIHFYLTKTFAILFLEIIQLFQNYSLCFEVSVIPEIIQYILHILSNSFLIFSDLQKLPNSPYSYSYSMQKQQPGISNDQRPFSCRYSLSEHMQVMVI